MAYCFNDTKSKAEFTDVSYNYQTIKGSALTVTGHGTARITLPVNPSTNGIPIGIMGIYTRSIGINSGAVCPVQVTSFSVNQNNIVVDLINAASTNITCNVYVILSTLNSNIEG